MEKFAARAGQMRIVDEFDNTLEPCGFRNEKDGEQEVLVVTVRTGKPIRYMDPSLHRKFDGEDAG